MVALTLMQRGGKFMKKIFKRSFFGLAAVLLTLGIGMNVKAVAVTQHAVKTMTYDQNKITGAQSNFVYTYKDIPVEARLYKTENKTLVDAWNYKRIKQTRTYVDHGIYY